MRFVRPWLTFIGLAACTAPAADAPGAPPPAQSPAEDCDQVGLTRCDGSRVVTCEAREGGGRGWSAAADCPGDQSCRNDACAAPTERARAQAASVRSFIAQLAPVTAWHEHVDVDALTTREERTVLRGDGSDAIFFGATWRALNAFPQGHQAMLLKNAADCGTILPSQNGTRFGVCGRPSPDGIAVTWAHADNRLGLRPGDVVIEVAGARAPQLFDDVYGWPSCGNVFPASSGRRYSAAASFFGVVPAKTHVTVRAVDGSTRELVIPEQSDPIESCVDPFGRSGRVYAEAKVRPDGVAVVRLPSFLPWDKPMPAGASPAAFEAYRDAYQSELVKIFDTVRSAPAVVWDTRGNSGGMTQVGLAIVAGFPSARPTSVSYCRTRTVGSDPPAFGGARQAIYDITPGGPFAYTGKVAVVTDGIAYSAGDYFTLAARRASDVPVAGSATAGAYGGGATLIGVAGPPPLSVYYDPIACFDAANDAPLEGNPPAPTVPVEYDPADLANGRDTVLEAAIKALSF